VRPGSRHHLCPAGSINNGFVKRYRDLDPTSKTWISFGSGAVRLQLQTAHRLQALKWH